MQTVRVLQVLPDTDSTDANLAALELHAGLAACGVEVRTLALGPGRTGQLAATVPVIAPSTRSIAAHTQLRAEQRWADVVLLRGAEVAAVSAFTGGSVARVIVLWDEPQRWADGGRPPLGARRAAQRCASVVVGWDAAVDVVAERFGIATDQIVVLPSLVTADIDAAQVSGAARAAARAEAGVPEDQLAVVVTGGGDTTFDLHELRSALDGTAVVIDPPVGAAAADDTLDAEVIRAAADIVVVDGVGGPSPELLRSMLAGAVVVAPPHPSLTDLVQDGVSARIVPRPVGPASVAAAVAGLRGADVRASVAAAGGRAVLARHRAADLMPRWLDLVHAALPSRP